MLVLFASQTGNAQEVAERIWREARRRGYKGAKSSPRTSPVGGILPQRLPRARRDAPPRAPPPGPVPALGGDAAALSRPAPAGP